MLRVGVAKQVVEAPMVEVSIPAKRLRLISMDFRHRVIVYM